MKPAPIQPAAQLTHPLFLGALAVLALNDHALKGAGLLPGALTGKLSDVAGLLVAPLVLAWLARARTRRGWVFAHVAVGLGFAALQHPAGADAFARLGLGRSWPDPTDLLALPALLVSASVFGRLPRPVSAGPRARALVGGVALTLCVATGGPAAPRYPFPPAGRLPGDVVVRHLGADDVVIRVRRLREELTPSCDGLIDEPEVVLTDDDLGDEQAWTLARGDAVPLWDRRGGALDRDCYAVRLSDSHGREWFVAWRHGAPEVRDWAIRLEPGEPAEPDAMRLGASEGEAPTAPPGVTVRPR